MLADECPNVRCYGVPLVRPPKAGAVQDPRKECVTCGTVYVRENDTSGLERLVSLDAQRHSGATAPPIASGSHKTGKNIICDETPQEPPDGLPLKMFAPGTMLPTLQPAVSSPPDIKLPPTTLSALAVAAQSLELTLHALSKRLTSYSTGQAVVDSGTIAVTADAIGRATYALSQVKQLQLSHSEIS